MKIGIFSDIHGNIYALESVWGELKKERCDGYYFLGDVCGYYYHHNEVIEVLRSIKNLVSIAGNHDRIFLKLLEGVAGEKEYAEKYGRSFTLFKENLKEENLMFLKGLPQEYTDESLQVALFHGSPWDSLNEYIYPTTSISRFKELPYRFVLLGHTHYAMDRSTNDVRVINPGSCGQPRDGSDPTYATVDLETGDVSIKKVKYDRRSLVEDVMKHDKDNMNMMRVLTKKNNGYE